MVCQNEFVAAIKIPQPQAFTHHKLLPIQLVAIQLNLKWDQVIVYSYRDEHVTLSTLADLFEKEKRERNSSDRNTAAGKIPEKRPNQTAEIRAGIILS